MDRNNTFMLVMGAFGIGYSFWIAVTGRVQVGFRYISVVILTGNKAFMVGIGYLIAGVLLIAPSALSFAKIATLPGDTLLILLIAGVGIIFIANFVGWLMRD